ncbi:MAG: hypothetical protein MZV70_72935 [Desulfobacterales bacterium]|nr:hypothetical protein [Desulfobacterales bacterium]
MERNFDLARELFHIITWNVFTSDEIGDGTKKTKPEQYADAFAANLRCRKNTSRSPWKRSPQAGRSGL